MNRAITKSNQPFLSEHSTPSELLICDNIAFPEGVLSRIWVGPCGIFATADPSQVKSPSALYSALRSRLGIPRIKLYLIGHGVYAHETGDYLSLFYPGRHKHPYAPLSADLRMALSQQGLSETLFDGHICSPEALTSMAEDFTTNGRIILAQEPRVRCVKRCREIDGYTRGEYIDAEGKRFLRRGDRFIPASNKDPETLFWLTVLGSCIGAHRFYLGRFFSGLMYLMTCGLCGIGWIIDLVLLFIGLVRDRKGQIVLTPSSVPKKALAASVGFLAAFCFLALYSRLLNLLSLGLNNGIGGIANDPSVMSLLDSFLAPVP